MRTMMMITIAVLMTMTMAKSEETIDTKVKNYVVNEWTDIKEYQKASWEEGKKQNAANWAKIKSFFTKVKDNVTQN
jgi:protein-disulfide isomerase-like protein with CxxC motif